jgi:predicted Zn-dependent peptidase
VLNTVYVFGLAKDYPETFRSRIAALTPEQVKSGAATLLGSQDSAIVIVGDWAKVKDQLTGFKDIVFLDTDGKKISPPGV